MLRKSKVRKIQIGYRESNAFCTYLIFFPMTKQKVIKSQEAYKKP